MTFQMTFRPASPAPGQVVTQDWPRPTDDQQTSIVRACAVLAEIGESRFHLRGFGRDQWHVDVAYDLSAVLEQLEDLVRALRADRPASLDLYTQGVESDLEFEPHGDVVQIRCRTRTAWTPEPAVEVVGRRPLIDMLGELAKQVARGLEMIDPRLISFPPFDAWARGDL